MNNCKRLAVIFLWMSMVVSFSRTVSGESFYDEKKDVIMIEGPLNTLSSVAEEINNPEIFSYDSQGKRAFCHEHIYLYGTLLIESETLEICKRKKADPLVKGNIIYVYGAGKLILTNGVLCASEGLQYDIWSWGRIEAFNSRIENYGADSARCFRLAEGSETILKDTVLSGNYIFIASPEAKVRIERCDFSRSNYNLRLASNITVSLIDCKLGKFPAPSLVGTESRILIKKSVEITLMDERGSPMGETQIFAVSKDRNDVEFQESAQTDKDGKCKIYPVIMDYYNSAHSLFKSDIATRADSEIYHLKRNWRPDKQKLVFKKKGEAFVECE